MLVIIKYYKRTKFPVKFTIYNRVYKLHITKELKRFKGSLCSIQKTHVNNCTFGCSVNCSQYPEHWPKVT